MLLAGLTALVWGTADYSGGRVSRHVNATSVTVVSQLLSLPVLAVCVLALPGHPYGVDLLWGAGAGAAGVIGVILLYASLASGAMAVAAPTSAVTGAAVPIAVGLAVGEQPSPLALAGVGCAVVAIALVSMSSTGGGGPVTGRVLGMALGSGALFGVFFVLLAQTHDDSGMWPLVGARLTSVVLGLTLVLGRSLPLRVPRRLFGWVLVSGAGDIGANALYLLATREGLLSVIAPVSALYPVATVLLAFGLDRERIRPVQVVGLGLAAVSLVLTAV